MSKYGQYLATVVVLLALVLVGCGPAKQAEPSGGAPQEQGVTEPSKGSAEEQAPAGEQAPTAASAPATQAPAEAETEGEEIVVRDVSEAEDITSYRSRVTIRQVEGDVTTESTISVEYTADGPAMHSVATGSSESENWEVIYIGDVVYMKGADGEWFTMQSEETTVPESQPAVFQWASPTEVLNTDSCALKGKETVEGVETEHYRCDEHAFQAASAVAENLSLTNGYLDYYIAPDLQIPVKTVIYWEGTSDGAPFSYQMESLISDVNTPITITAPEGVTPPGAGEDVPVMDGAEDVASFSGMVSYLSAQPMADVAAWYEAQMPANGWTLNAESSMSAEDMVQQAWTKDGRTATIMVTPSDSGAAVVITTAAE